MEDVTAAAETPEPPKGEAAPKAEKPTAPTPPKPPEKKTEATKPTTPKPEGKVDGIEQVRRRLEEVQKSEKEKLAEIETLRKQNEEYNKRRFVTPEMEAEIEQNKKEIADLRKSIAESHYEKSDEFKKQYVEPYTQARDSAVEAAKSYIITNDEDGTTRQATADDFARVMNAPRSERAGIAQKLFGINGLNVLADIRDMERIRQQAEVAIKNHRDSLEGKSKEQENQSREMEKQYMTHREASRRQLAEEFPQFFSEPADDPEAADAWKKGLEFVDNAAQRMKDMSVDERAAVAEVMRARAAWFPRGHKELTRTKAKVAELEAELAKYRGSDPGSEKEKGGEPPKADDGLRGGIEALTARFDNLS